MQKEHFTFDLAAVDGKARAGIFHTPHGDLETPVFGPGRYPGHGENINPGSFRRTGASLVLSNTYHLYLRPGADLVAEMGGLHHFMQWPHPMLTDLGGFQVFSLADMRKVDEDGVTFKSHIDGSTHRFTPEKAIEIQEQLGADIIMAFDECSDPNDRAYVERAMQRTHAWAERCRLAQKRSDQALFGIVQGGIFPDLRENSARTISGMGFPGHAIGGLSVGEEKKDMYAMIDVVNAVLPMNKPRYLMGVGTVEDLIHGIARGIDIFDCVLPTRLARHQAAMTRRGRLNLLNAVHARDPRPIDESCGCYTCRTFTRAYLRHLIVAKEMLAGTLISIHNLYTLVELAKDARRAIQQQRFADFASELLSHLE